MKKILMGLLAISSLVFASVADVDLAATATPDTNVFQTGQTGAINITGKITSDVPIVKYVIFASTDDGVTKKDTLALSDFILTTGEGGGFAAVNPKVYVKQINSSQDGVEDVALNIKFKVKTESIESNWFGDNFEMLPTQFLSKQTLLDVITAVNPQYPFEVVNGVIANSAVIYAQAKSVHFKVIGKGILEVTSDTRTIHTDRGVTGVASDFDAAFAGGKNISNAKLMVEVK